MSIKSECIIPLLQVFDMPKSISFYRDLLGFEVTSAVTEDGKPTPDIADDFQWAMLKLNDMEIMLNTAYEPTKRPDEPEAKRIEAHADTILYFYCTDVEGTYYSIISKSKTGVNIPPPSVTSYGWKVLFLYDPDGYQLCFHSPVEK